MPDRFKILHVDPDESWRECTAAALKGLRAKLSSEADFRRFKKFGKPDLLITELNLDHRSWGNIHYGIDLAKYFLVRNPDIALIFLSGCLTVASIVQISRLPTNRINLIVKQDTTSAKIASESARILLQRRYVAGSSGW